MKTLHHLAFGCVFAIGAAYAGPPAVAPVAHLRLPAAQTRLTVPGFRDVVRRVAPSVVTVLSAHVARESDGSTDALAVDLGSGVVLNTGGYVVTSNHVVSEGMIIAVALADGSVRPAALVGSDRAFDLALLKVEGDGLEPIVLGDLGDVEVGDVVLAIGNSMGLGQTVTQGIVSAKRHVGGNDAVGQDFIQTDAAISPGNSGGALVDATGRLIGINTAIVSVSGGSEGIGFAIPVDVVRIVTVRLMIASNASRRVQ
jgi:S1-C subfamily serine protease